MTAQKALKYQQDTFQTELVKKLKTLMVARLIIVTLFLVAGFLILELERTPFYIIIAVFYFATALYAIFLRLRFHIYLLAYIQIFIDIILETVIIHYAGGADSIFVLLYVPSVVSAGVVVSGRAAKMIAGKSSILYAAISSLEFFRVIAPGIGAEVIYREGPWTMMFIVSFRVIIICLVGYLASYLSGRLYQERSALFRLRNLTELILSNIKNGVITVDMKDLVVYTNPAVKEILGKDMDIAGVCWPDLFWEGPGKDVINNFIMQAKIPIGAEIEIKRKDGKEIILRCNYSVLSDEKDNTIGGVITFRDLTLERELELEVRQREKLSGMGELAIGIAHEIRNPLAAIKGSLEVLKERLVFSGENDKLMNVIFKESERLNHILEDFLKYAKEKKPEVKYEDIGEILDEVCLLLKHEGRWGRELELERRIMPAKIMLHIDPEQIKQVFYNLLLNALDVLQEGGKITTEINESPQDVTIRIKDTGRGIPKNEADKIFQPFYSTKNYGLGVGLGIARRIIEAHKGRIELLSEEGTGTVVTVILPKEL